MPAISVIVPVYKVEKYIHRCVDSILGQTCADFELILVDDGSPDNCGAICDEYAVKDSRVTVIHRENGGLSAARNTGIDWTFSNSDSRWLTFIDSDDWVDSTYLEKMLTAANSEKADLCACLFIRATSEHPEIPENQSETRLAFGPQDFFCAEAEGFSVIPACMKMYRKKLFSEIRFPVGKLNEDLFTTHKLIFACDRIVLVNQILYFYYQSPGSIMRAAWSPRRMDEITGYEELLSYLRENGYQRAYNRAVCFFFGRLLDQYQNLLQPENAEYGYYLRKFRRMLRSMIRKHAKTLGISFNSSKWVYSLVYPRLMNCYWLLSGIFRRRGKSSG